MLFTVVAALTLLPALLGFFGPKRAAAPQRRAPSGGRTAVATPTSRRAGRAGPARLRAAPGAAGAIAAASLMLVLAVPFLSMRLGSSDQGNDPTGTTTRKAYDLLAKGFGPGFNGPLQLVAQRRRDRPTRQRSRAWSHAVGDDADGVVGGDASRVSSRRRTAPRSPWPASYPSASPQDAATTDLVDRLREQTSSRGATRAAT